MQHGARLSSPLLSSPLLFFPLLSFSFSLARLSVSYVYVIPLTPFISAAGRSKIAEEITRILPRSAAATTIAPRTVPPPPPPPPLPPNPAIGSLSWRDRCLADCNTAFRSCVNVKARIHVRGISRRLSKSCAMHRAIVPARAGSNSLAGEPWRTFPADSRGSTEKFRSINPREVRLIVRVVVCRYRMIS